MRVACSERKFSLGGPIVASVLLLGFLTQELCAQDVVTKTIRKAKQAIKGAGDIGQGVLDVGRGKKSEDASRLKAAGQGGLDLARGKDSPQAKALLENPAVMTFFPAQSVAYVAVVKPEATEQQIRNVVGATAEPTLLLVETSAQGASEVLAAQAKLASLAPGSGVEAVVRLGNLSTSYLASLAYSSVQVSRAVIEGKDPKVVAGVFLAAALWDAYGNLVDRGKPIPAPVKERLLACGFARASIEKARYTVDANLSIDLVGGIHLTNKVFSPQSNHAVTILELIVFRDEPGVEDIRFWAHEMGHVEQYSLWGLEGFAGRYTLNYSWVERAAEAQAQRCLGALQ